jgi:hypothetical protein
MKKTLLFCFVIATTTCFAQKAGNKISFSKGQKIEVVTNTNITAQSMMGPSSGTVTTADVYLVNDVSTGGTTLLKQPRQMKIALSAGSQEIKLDSDNPKDLSGPLGQPVKEIMNQKPEFTVDAYGKIIAVKGTDNKKKEGSPDGGMLAMMIPGMSSSAVMPQVGSPSLFQVLPNREVSVGDTWTDSVSIEGSKNITNYKVKSITDSEVVLEFDLSGTTVGSQSMMGQSIDVNSSVKGTGTITIDKASGIIKQKQTTNTTETAMNLMGRDITSTGKTTSVMNVTIK